LTGAFFGAGLLTGAFFGAGLLTGAFFGAAFFGPAFLTGAFLGAAFLAGAFLTGDFFGAAFLGAARFAVVVFDFGDAGVFLVAMPEGVVEGECTNGVTPPGDEPGWSGLVGWDAPRSAPRPTADRYSSSKSQTRVVSSRRSK